MVFDYELADELRRAIAVQERGQLMVRKLRNQRLTSNLTDRSDGGNKQELDISVGRVCTEVEQVADAANVRLEG